MKATTFALILVLALAGCHSGTDSSRDDNSPPSALSHLQQDKVGTESLAVDLAVTLLPQPLTSAENARAIVQNCQETTLFTWSINEKKVTGEQQTELSHSLFVRGDRVQVAIQCGVQTALSESSVENSPPEITDISFNLTEISPHKDLHVYPVAVDTDDDLIDFTYQWFINGNILEDFNNDRLPAEFILKNSRIFVTITPYDGSDYGSAVTSQTLDVLNSAPQFTTTPPALVTSPYTYFAVATDPDEDAVSYKLGMHPEGMHINQSSGQLSWPVDSQTAPGDYLIEIEAVDNDGASAKQTFTLSLTKPEN